MAETSWLLPRRSLGGIYSQWSRKKDLANRFITDPQRPAERDKRELRGSEGWPVSGSQESPPLHPTLRPRAHLGGGNRAGPDCAGVLRPAPRRPRCHLNLARAARRGEGRGLGARPRPLFLARSLPSPLGSRWAAQLPERLARRETVEGERGSRTVGASAQPRASQASLPATGPARASALLAPHRVSEVEGGGGCRLGRWCRRRSREKDEKPGSG